MASEPLNRRIGLFDSDCLELAVEGGQRSGVLPDFSFRERIRPQAAKLDALYALAKEHDLTLVFTQCCSSRPVTPGAHPDVLVVPRDPSDQSWAEQVGRYRLINIEKVYDAPLTESFICRHFDTFQHNPNARRLFELLDIPKWVVFGHGFDLCVDSSVKGILASGYRAHILTDVLAPSASGYGPYGTEESGRSILEYLERIGVTTGSLGEFLDAPDA